jgi:hypothetical protein
VSSSNLMTRLSSLEARSSHHKARTSRLAYSKAHINTPTSGNNVVVADIDLSAAEVVPIGME